MYATEQPTAEFRITATRTVADQTERQRRMGQAYDAIMSFGRQKRVVAQIESHAQPRAVD